MYILFLSGRLDLENQFSKYIRTLFHTNYVLCSLIPSHRWVSREFMSTVLWLYSMSDWEIGLRLCQQVHRKPLSRNIICGCFLKKDGFLFTECMSHQSWPNPLSPHIILSGGIERTSRCHWHPLLSCGDIKCHCMLCGHWCKWFLPHGSQRQAASYNVGGCVGWGLYEVSLCIYLIWYNA